jgi:hypothetical protein
MRPTVDANKAIVRELLEQCCNDGNLDLVADYVAADCRWRDGAPFGPEHWRTVITIWRSAFPDFAYRGELADGGQDLIGRTPTTFTALSSDLKEG